MCVHKAPWCNVHGALWIDWVRRTLQSLVRMLGAAAGELMPVKCFLCLYVSVCVHPRKCCALGMVYYNTNEDYNINLHTHTHTYMLFTVFLAPLLWRAARWRSHTVNAWSSQSYDTGGLGASKICQGILGILCKTVAVATPVSVFQCDSLIAAVSG